MQDKLTGMIMASFIGDSLAMPVHWIYDTKRILADHGTVNRLMKPGVESYHRSKDKGEFTHYGDQQMILLESVALEKGFSADHFSKLWLELFKDYKGYYDHATKDTLKNLSEAKSPLAAGSDSKDFSAAGRIAPLVCAYRQNVEKMLEAITIQTQMTHDDPLVIESARFFGQVTLQLILGGSILDSIKKVGEKSFKESPLMELIKKGITSTQADSIETIVRFGQSCYVADVFPGIIHLIVKYQDNIEEALINAVMGGGDNAARAIMTGMVLGSYLGYESLPNRWVNDLKQRDRISKLIKNIL